MATIMQSVTKIKYNGEFYPAYTPFEVEDADVDSLVAKGCHIIKKARNYKRLSPLDSKED